MKKAIFLAALCSLMNQLFAQVNADDLFNTITTNRFSNAVTNVQTLSLNEPALRTLNAARPNDLALRLPYNGLSLEMQLSRVQPLSNDFALLITTESGTTTKPYQQGLYYQGHIIGKPQSRVAISLFDNKIMGLICDETGNYTLGKVAESEDYVLYRDNNLRQPPSFTCANDETTANFAPHLPSASSRNLSSDTISIYYECDYALYARFGSDTATANYVTGLFNIVQTLFAIDGIPVKLSPLRIWVSPHSYNQGGPMINALENFRNARPNYSGDQAQLLTISGAGSGGLAAGINTFCTPYSYSYAEITDFYENLPTFSWSVFVSIHELGHCFGSHHTHWCGWVGGPIDGCAGSENVELAPDGTICGMGSIPSEGGTIMSYCHSSVGTNFNLGFGIQPRQHIQTAIAERFCSPNSTTGAIRVMDIEPSSAEWRVDNQEWYSKEDIAINIPAGNHIVSL